MMLTKTPGHVLHTALETDDQIPAIVLGKYPHFEVKNQTIIFSLSLLQLLHGLGST